MTAVTISEIPYSATNPIATNATTVNALMSLLSREQPEEDASVAVFPCSVSVVCCDMPCTPFPMRSCVCNVSLSQKQTFLEVSRAQNHRFVGNDLNAFFQPLEGVPAPVRFRPGQPAAWSSPGTTGPSPGEPRSPLAIRPYAVWIASRKLLSGCSSGQACSQGA